MIFASRTLHFTYSSQTLQGFIFCCAFWSSLKMSDEHQICLSNGTQHYLNTEKENNSVYVEIPLSSAVNKAATPEFSVQTGASRRRRNLEKDINLVTAGLGSRNYATSSQGQSGFQEGVYATAPGNCLYPGLTVPVESALMTSQLAGGETLDDSLLSPHLPNGFENSENSAGFSELSLASTENSVDCCDLNCSRKLKELKQRTQKLEHLVSSYRRLYSTTEDEKLQEISRLQKLLKEKSKSVHISSEEVERLRTSLSETIQQCQSLQCKINSSEICPEATAEVIRLRQKLNDAVEANKRWQIYNSQREQFVNQTIQNVSILESELQRLRTRPALSEEQQREFDQVLLNSKRKVEEAQASKEKLEDEMLIMRKRLQQKNEEVQRLSEQLRERVSLTHRRPPHPGHPGHSEESDQLAVLKMQVRACTEDFEAERADREAAQAKVVELQKQLQYCRSRRVGLTARGPAASPLTENVETDSLTGVNIDELNLQNNTNGNSFNSGGDVTVVMEGNNPQMNLSQHNGVPESFVDNEPRQNGGLLRCPKCWKQYSQTRSAELLEHIEVCTV
ncbi:centrosomal protein of 55 kDa-like [Lingula anatina]|uniref:Centrosomal protein of 55 kDa-like n=1 Tax=Lingula anatina TaxID=7574 RepID=A0A1S3HZ06_LINAN|nr:centrosomal protein of 55 kDa-like [Lingula anatina]XP_013391253.1 centrosomal protein of 55 kDa-like [Lingula anatina]XP_013391254.1 centrosomal protein of 55 kDa-like [Lingula anatina]XP_013391255.1 centrosomal protein of 55 kDa-like [Lingula anatina]XP_013391256.1 centrosomal protein of 55 kDa-like [Lingula anatina]XP_013391257.1 centrosomal protein of 55 kDa-like [Lingula anatina]XP_013391258.1 centrosomal protein of 55 kDa-like [Lingula anatina]|eukprot:XP_013391252.1 centrosomal protein of 55 kDa-like [Lingula anatina]